MGGHGPHGRACVLQPARAQPCSQRVWEVAGPLKDCGRGGRLLAWGPGPLVRSSDSAGCFAETRDPVFRWLCRSSGPSPPSLQGAGVLSWPGCTSCILGGRAQVTLSPHDSVTGSWLHHSGDLIHEPFPRGPSFPPICPGASLLWASPLCVADKASATMSRDPSYRQGGGSGCCVSGRGRSSSRLRWLQVPWAPRALGSGGFQCGSKVP